MKVKVIHTYIKMYSLVIYYRHTKFERTRFVNVLIPANINLSGVFFLLFFWGGGGW